MLERINLILISKLLVDISLVLFILSCVYMIIFEVFIIIRGDIRNGKNKCALCNFDLNETKKILVTSYRSHVDICVSCSQKPNPLHQTKKIFLSFFAIFLLILILLHFEILPSF